MAKFIQQAVSLVKNWWLILLSGMLQISGSIWIFNNPSDSFITLAWLFIALVLLNGISYVIFSISNHKVIDGWGWYLVGGIFEIIIGIFLVFYPEISLVILPLVVGFWFLFRGIQIIGVSLNMRDYGSSNWGWIMILGILLSTIAFLILLDPVIGFFSVVYLTAFGMVIFGLANIMISFRLKKIKSKTINNLDAVRYAFKFGLGLEQENV